MVFITPVGTACNGMRYEVPCVLLTTFKVIARIFKTQNQSSKSMTIQRRNDTLFLTAAWKIKYLITEIFEFSISLCWTSRWEYFYEKGSTLKYCLYWYCYKVVTIICPSFKNETRKDEKFIFAISWEKTSIDAYNIACSNAISARTTKSSKERIL